MRMETMWVKILRGIYAVAVATGLDKKVKDWVARKAAEAYEKVSLKAGKKLDEIEKLLADSSTPEKF
jgi:hypothetical protein